MERTLRSSGNTVVWAAVIAAAALLVYSSALHNGFAYDAVTLVEDDARIHSPDGFLAPLFMSYWPEDHELGLYRPLTTFSFAADWALYSGRAWGFHLTNVLLHAVASVLVFATLLLLVPTAPAAAGALVFAVHPLHVEAVAGIVGRADILGAILSLAAIIAWAKWEARPALLALVTFMLYLLALGAKESSVMLPALLLLFDAVRGRLRRAGFRQWLVMRGPALLAIAGAAVMYGLIRLAVLGSTPTPEHFDPIIAVVPPGGMRVRTVLQVWPEFLRLFLFPRVLLPDYGPRILMPAWGWTPAAIAGALLLFAAIGGGLWALITNKPRTALALLWTPVVLLPVSNLIVPIGIMLAERTLYLAAFPVALGVAAAVETLSTRGRAYRRAVVLGVAIVSVLGGVRIVEQIPVWNSTDHMFRALLAERPDSYRGHWHHARMAWRDGELESAMYHYRTAIELWPYAPPLHHEAVTFAGQIGDHDAVVRMAQNALQLWSGDVFLLRRLATAALTAGDTAVARRALQQGLRVAPNDPLFMLMRGAIGGPVER